MNRRKNLKPEDAYLVAELSKALEKEANGHVNEEPPASGVKSLFTHEAEALLAIERHVKTHGLGETLTNLELHDPQSNRYFEVDLVLVSRFRIYVVELKHWSGRIEIRPNNWEQNNSFSKADPHKSNGFKAKLLRGLYQRQFPSFPDLYFESVVVLTNPEVEAIGCANAKTTNNNPTFDGLDRFFQYLWNQRLAHVAKLSDNQCRGFADYVRKLNVGGRPKDFVFPGYEIVERLYQFEDRAEVVARRTDLRHRKMSRLRIFFLQSGDQRAKEKATATLNAVELIGDHPNILKVWDIPNENNYLVEGSDWSETGTLRDCLDRSRFMKPQAVLAVAIGLAMGLKAAHAQLVVHRSLSPENVLMVNDTPKLMNFDLSFQLEDNRLTVIPDVSQLKRSPYIAPEIYKGGMTPEATADLFSVGVMLYEMLVGERPFGCSTDLELSQGKLREEQLGKVRIVDGVDERLVGLIDCLVRESPASRLSSADSVIELLSECLDGPVDEAPIEANRLLDANERHGLYEIVEFIGHGAEAQIYKAAGVGGKPVLLKLFKRDVLLQRVVSEYRFAGTVRHPSLVRVDSYSQWNDGRYFIAFDWLSGGTLREEISKGNRPDIATFQRGVLQLLGALAVLHSNQENDIHSPILHNDIKPENIFLAGERLILIDFGAASEPRVGTYEG
ncbi:MAG: serine/threonine protein kinase, partial [Proteobacteria bacterium]